MKKGFEYFKTPFYLTLILILVFAVAYKDIKNTNSISREQELILNRLDKMDIYYNTVGENTSGYYLADSENILLFTKENHPNLILKNAIHEIGHYIWYEFMSIDERNEYVIAYSKTDEYSTKYSKKSHTEDFAENIELGYFNITKVPKDRRELIRQALRWIQ